MSFNTPEIRKRAIQLGVLLIIVGLLYIVFFYTVNQRTYPQNYETEKVKAFLGGLSLQSGNPSGKTVTLGSQSWIEVANRNGNVLYMEPQYGQVAIRTAEGDIWYGNPNPEELAQDVTAGLWKNNASSPFLINYRIEGEVIEQIANVIDAPTKVEWQMIDQGIGIRYSMESLGFVLYVEYTLDDQGFNVSMPEQGVLEPNDKMIISVALLPFFGATLNGTEGYLFLPDGPGALVSFNRTNNLTLSYDYPIYGNDLAVRSVGSNQDRSPIAYPVYGLKRGDQAYVAIIEEGEFQANIVALPAGLRTSFNQVYSNVILRRYYQQRKGLDRVENVYEKYLNATPIQMKFMFLDKADADYVGMAKKFRNFLIQSKSIKPLPKPVSQQPPLQLDFVLAASERPTVFGNNVVVATTLEEVNQIVNELYDQGIQHMQVSLRGWQKDGFMGTLPDRFPFNSSVGGFEGLNTLKQNLEAKGIPLLLSDDLQVATDRFGNGFSPRYDAARKIDRPYIKRGQFNRTNGQNKDYFVVSPAWILNQLLPQTIAEWKKLPIDGIHLTDDRKNGLISDFNMDYFSSRERSAQNWETIYSQLQQLYGNTATSLPYDFMIGRVSHMFDLPLRYNYDLMVDEEVPFYPIVLRGLVHYSAAPGNLRQETKADLLRDLEYGALPSYILTHNDVRELRLTHYDWLGNGQYKLTKEQMLNEYRAYREVGQAIWTMPISNHRKITEGVFETTYENGTRVVVNYNEVSYTEEPYKVPAGSYQVLKGAVAE